MNVPNGCGECNHIPVASTSMTCDPDYYLCDDDNPCHDSGEECVYFSANWHCGECIPKFENDTTASPEVTDR